VGAEGEARHNEGAEGAEGGSRPGDEVRTALSLAAWAASWGVRGAKRDMRGGDVGGDETDVPGDDGEATNATRHANTVAHMESRTEKCPHITQLPMHSQIPKRVIHTMVSPCTRS
jgi:hypothetical protein